MTQSQTGFQLKFTIYQANRGKQTALGAPGVSARPRRTPSSPRLRFLSGLL